MNYEPAGRPESHDSNRARHVKGLPAPLICDYLSREALRKNYTEGTEFQIGRIDMVANTGTYIDCPFHRYAEGKDLNGVGLERFVDLPGVVVRVNYRRRIEIDVPDFEDVDVTNRAVLVPLLSKLVGIRRSDGGFSRVI